MQKRSALTKVSLLLAAALMTSNVSQGQNCNETSFPRLSPGARAAQTESDRSNPLNIGTLDVRAMGAGGYSEGTFSGIRYGVYRLRGGPQRYDGTLTRVERFFNPVTRAPNRNIRLTASFVAVDASDRALEFAQVHLAGSNIVAGVRNGQRARSALILAGFEKTSNPNVFEVVVSESVEPFTTDLRGRRVDTSMRRITRGVEYRLIFTTGYDSRNRSFSTITIRRADDASDSVTIHRRHTFTTDRKVIRYGAYEAADRGDTGSEIRFRNVRLCRNN